ncbi:type VII secretion-associated serine protease mycosin [Mycolicibacterium peregrinum]|uniref:type VII secretion-associated serine protease mycosin n=1 Tax=Mycolicibacterium peregrinum TaxID=43304 RepID=UPI000B4A780C|nr:type VII secretion-associated serine protease mycosin [Mycolicibacterium peregrinum]OWM07845.1 type VII secretion-associated serine protease mycosin [Mycolicibacterium peregrinum]
MSTNRTLRGLALAATVSLAMLTAPPAAAIAPPVIDPAAVPPDTTGPEQPLEQRKACMAAFATEGAVFNDAQWSQRYLQLGEAHKWSTGKDVLVAVIDTGVNGSPRVPAEPGGDYITPDGDGLSDCDAHGSLVASLIAGRPAPEDAFVGVAPEARIVSIRHTSKAFSPTNARKDPNDPNQSEAAGSIRTLARAIVHAANLGARVINISLTACIKATERIDQNMLGAAVRYAVVDKDAVVVAAAGNQNEGGLGGSCVQNPPPSADEPDDPFGWGNVKTVVSPAWYSPLVLSVGAITENGKPADFSMSGPWVAAAAPGERSVALFNNVPVNARPGDEGPVDINGTSFSSAYVAGVAALVRAKYPDWTANQVMDRILRTARHPGAGRDNTVGYGPVDALAALTWDVPLGPQVPTFPTKQIPPPPPPYVPDRGPNTLVLLVVAGSAVVAAAVWLIRRAVGSR